MGAVGLADSVWRRVHVVGPGASVDVYVYESGRDVAVTGVDDDVRRPACAALGNADDLAVNTLDGAALQDFLREDDPAGESNACRSHEKRIS